MKYFKNTNNEIFAFDNEQVKQGYGKDLIPIAKEEKDKILAPSPEQILQQKKNKLKQERDKALENITYTFDDNSIIQVRPKDLPNINIAIQQNQDTKWIMADNTIRTVTVDELKEAMASGIAQGKAIWADYMSKLEELEN